MKAIKNYNKTTIVLHFIIGIWFIVPIILARPFVHIYFVLLRSDRIGHFILDTEILLARVGFDASKSHKKTIVLGLLSMKIVNFYVYQIWKQHLNIIPFRRLSAALYDSCLVIEKIFNVKLIYRFKNYDDFVKELYLLEKSPTFFSMPAKDEHECRELLRSNGIDTDIKWVCILNRDLGYLQYIYPHLDWDFSKYRNSDIRNYISAAEYLAGKNIQVFRMGSHTSETFYSNKSNLLIDYANSSWRSDKLDIFLAAHCLFFISSGTGLDAVATALRKPLVFVDYAMPLNLYYSKPQHIIIFKKFLDTHKNEYLSPSKYFKIGNQGGFTIDNKLHLRSQDLEYFRIQVKDNTPDEIREVVTEMYETVTQGRMNHNPSQLQKLFWKNYPETELYSHKFPVRCKIGEKFLHQNQWLVS